MAALWLALVPEESRVRFSGQFYNSQNGKRLCGSKIISASEGKLDEAEPSSKKNSARKEDDAIEAVAADLDLSLDRSEATLT